MIDDLGGKILQRLIGAIRDEREKRTKRADDDTRNLEGGLAGGKVFDGCDKLCFAVFFGKLEGCLQGRMKTVTARFRGHFSIAVVVIMLRAGKCIAPEPARRRFG